MCDALQSETSYAPLSKCLCALLTYRIAVLFYTVNAQDFIYPRPHYSYTAHGATLHMTSSVILRKDCSRSNNDGHLFPA